MCALGSRKTTFLERFSRVYDYPYGSSYLASENQPKGTEMINDSQFERIILTQRNMRPFHLQCPITNKKICFCNKESSFLVYKDRQAKESYSMLSSAYQQVAYDTHLYYEGHPSDMLEKAYDKLALERERMM
jgi:hypothetical protein